MSTHVKYDPDLFSLQRVGALTARLGQLILGESRLGQADSAWTPVEMATVTISGGYQPDENGTLIVGPTNANVSISSWTNPCNPLLPGDRIRAVYDTVIVFEGVVDTTQTVRETHPDAAHYGAQCRWDFTATALGDPWIAMQRIVSWVSLPQEPAIDRLRRWITVEGWPD